MFYRVNHHLLGRFLNIRTFTSELKDKQKKSSFGFKEFAELQHPSHQAKIVLSLLVQVGVQCYQPFPAALVEAFLVLVITCPSVQTPQAWAMPGTPTCYNSPNRSTSSINRFLCPYCHSRHLQRKQNNQRYAMFPTQLSSQEL